MKPEEIHKRNLAQSCEDALNKFIGNPTSKVLREEYERKKGAFKDIYSVDWKSVTKNERVI